MRLRVFLLFVIIALAACAQMSAPTPPGPTPTPPDDLAVYRQDLIPSAQNDVALVDHPTRYDMTLTYDPSQPALVGSEQVLYFNHQSVALDEVYFRLFANYPDSGGSIVVSTLSADGTPVTPAYEVQNTALRVPLPSPLEPAHSVRLDLSFRVSIPRHNAEHYADFTADDTAVTLPSIYPLIPAYDSQGWHTELGPDYGDLVYADVSFYKVAITAPSSMTVIASGSTVGTKDNGNGTKTWSIVGAPMRDFDINLTDQLHQSVAQVGDTTVNSYYEAADAQGGQAALKYASDALRDYDGRFGVYPYRELDVVETPTTAGGIEYPGIVVIGRALYSNPRQREYFEFAVAHEVSHQWWYGVVGDDQVNHPWVDEALAQYSALIYEQDVHGTPSGQSILKNYFQALYDKAKSTGHDAAVDQPVKAFDQNDYTAIVYGKAPLFYDALRSKMGDKLFFEFLRTYYERFRYKIATPQDIINTAESVYGASLQDIYQQWIESPKPSP